MEIFLKSALFGWRKNALPVQDLQQPFAKATPLSAYSADLVVRDSDGKFMVTGQVLGNSGVHTATDSPISAMGPGAWSFTGVLDNTDVFFHLAQASVRGVVKPNFMSSSKKINNLAELFIEFEALEKVRIFSNAS